ncbi:hypothetical protein NECAME_14827 [Necator americanus]|uniref:Uncharacterized protein n=1 Tax=Necator americanus TaxID=51031 RepID=W2SL17_NECAM|nr:hypothetical protein NECAME_14827 [Necator americanus]ETN70354.1 hypothetical protein NECAME_14827 [Necator americanus]
MFRSIKFCKLLEALLIRARSGHPRTGLTEVEVEAKAKECNPDVDHLRRTVDAFLHRLRQCIRAKEDRIENE